MIHFAFSLTYSHAGTAQLVKIKKKIERNYYYCSYFLCLTKLIDCTELVGTEIHKLHKNKKENTIPL